MKVQVPKEHYDFLYYVDASRWSSYYCQIIEVLCSKASTVLIIGLGDGLIDRILKWIVPETVIETFDFDRELHPDIIGDVRKLSSCIKKQYDVIVCCQVLEHLVFGEFEQAVGEISACLRVGVLRLFLCLIRV